MAEIYQELEEGLSLYYRGHLEEASFHWCFLYGCHWARHALFAFFALEIYRVDNFIQIQPRAVQREAGNLKPKSS